MPTNSICSKDFAVGVLATIAAILLVGLALVQSDSGHAYAGGMTTTSSTGNYLMTVGSFTQVDEEFVYIIDTSTDRMVAYRFDSNRRQLELLEGIELAELRQGAPGAAPPARSTQPARRSGSPPPPAPAPAPQQPVTPPRQP